jgi:DNA-directed RNA polymerase II subunit RPB1
MRIATALCCVLLFPLSVALGQVTYTYYVEPVTALYTPTTVYYDAYSPSYVTAAPVTTYYSTSAVPTTTYYATTAYYTPWNTYYAPATSYYVPTTTYYVPTTTYYVPTTTYYVPTTTYYAPTTTYYAPSAVVASQVFYPGQPIRNLLRAILPP